PAAISMAERGTRCRNLFVSFPSGDPAWGQPRERRIAANHIPDAGRKGDEMSKEYYVRSAVTYWGSLNAVVSPGVEVPLKSDDGCIGCLLVYESREAFEREHPGEEPLV